MPNRPKHECPQPGCHVLVSGKGRCDKHRTDANQARGTAASRGYGSRWRKARRAFLSENPLCKTCEARDVVTEATVVDHVVPHKGDDTLFWDPKNWQSQCEPCHNTKTATEDGGFGT